MSDIDQHTRWADLKQRLKNSTLATGTNMARDRTREIYRQRAARLAMPDSRGDTGRETTRMLTFLLSGQRCAIPLCHAARAYPLCPLTPVPGAPSWVLGIGSFESQVRSVIDLAELLHAPAERSEATGTVLLIRCDDGAAAVRVDRVDEVLDLDLAELAAPDQLLDSAATGLVRGLTPEHVIVVSAQGLLAYVVSHRETFS